MRPGAGAASLRTLVLRSFVLLAWAVARALSAAFAPRAAEPAPPPGAFGELQGPA